MDQHQLPPGPGPAPQDDPSERVARAITLPLLAQAAGILGALALVVGVVGRLEPTRAPAAPTVTFVERGARGAELPALTYSPMATAITPITSLTASRPTELGGSTSGSLYASADRIDIYARTSSSTATLNLVEYLPDDGKWVKHGADCAVTTNLTLCRYVAKRGARYWHVYKASGSMAYVGIEQAYNQGASLGSIEPSGPGISLPLGVSDGGTGLTGFTAGDLLYASGTTTLAKRGIGTEGQVLRVVSGTPTWASGFTPVLTKLTSGSGNWTPTTGATMVRVILIGGGGGGGSGRQGTNNSSSGGGGGGAGGYAEAIYAIADLHTPVAYSVGAGGAGGAAKAFNADGNAGAAGAVTTFGSHLRAGGGGGGGGGTTTTGTQGTSAGSTWTGTQLGGAGSNSNGNYAGAQDPFTLTLGIGLFLGQGPGAGGGGGGGSTSSTRIGGTGGFRPIYASGGAVGGQTLGAAGAAGAAGLPVGLGGGGGAGGNQASTPGGAGGNGGNYGGGGGGGGGSCTDGVTGQPSGKGGDGAGGVIWIFEW